MVSGYIFLQIISSIPLQKKRIPDGTFYLNNSLYNTPYKKNVPSIILASRFGTLKKKLSIEIKTF